MVKGRVSVIGICGESIFMRLDHFHEVGETVVTDNIHIEAGGKGVNQALTLAKLGADVSFLTALGNDAYAKECEKVFADAGLKYQIAYKTGVKTDVGVILTDKTGENQVTVYSGASKMLNANDVYAFEEHIANSEYLLMQLECSNEVLKAGVEIAKKHGVKVILNPAPARAVSEEILKDIYYFTPNELESEILFKHYVPTKYVVTLGKKGAKCVDENGEVFVDACPGVRKNTTGAGDVFNGAFVYALLNGKSFIDATKFGNAASSYKIESNYVLDGIPTLEEVNKRVEFYNK
ncbi:MAG: ribokinase [Clostridia bacterium]|nr:ribokinase [Clostridia bacterium]